MAVVTFYLTDITAAPLPSGIAPEVVFTPSTNAATASGQVAATRPKVYTPASSGLVTANLISSDDVADSDFYYTLQIRWLNSDGFGGSGYTSVDFPNWKIRVPAGGGSLTDFTSLPARSDVFWIGTTAPPAGSGYLFWIDISGSTPVLKGWQ